MIIRFLAVVGLLTVFGLVAACFSDSQAVSNNTNAELEARVAKLEKLVSDDRAFAQAASSSSNTGSMKATATNVADIGQFLGYGRHAYAIEYATIRSSTGYKAVIALGIPGDNYLEPMVSARPFFEGTGCTGEMYVDKISIRPDTRRSGIVFAVNTDYFAVPASPTIVSASTLSRHDGYGNCIEETHTIAEAIKLVPNDPAVTAFQNGPYTGPFQVGT